MSKLTDLRQRVAEKNNSLPSSSQNFYTSTPPYNPPSAKKDPGGKLSNLRQAVSVPRSAPKRRPVGRATSQVVMSGGWYHIGTPKYRVYRVEDLASTWRAVMRNVYGAETPNLAYPWYLRPKLLEWLKADGHTHCEAVVRYAVEMWAVLANQFDLVDVEYPMLNVIYGYRKGIAKQMQISDKRTWGSHYQGVNDEEAIYEEAVS